MHHSKISKHATTQSFSVLGSIAMKFAHNVPLDVSYMLMCFLMKSIALNQWRAQLIDSVRLIVRQNQSRDSPKAKNRAIFAKFYLIKKLLPEMIKLL